MSESINKILSDVAKSEAGDWLVISEPTARREYSIKHPRQELPLLCAKLGLMCLWHRGTLRYLIIKRDQWEDRAN